MLLVYYVAMISGLCELREAAKYAGLIPLKIKQEGSP